MKGTPAPPVGTVETERVAKAAGRELEPLDILLQFKG